MTAGSLKKILDDVDPACRVTISVNTPGGWICPDGCTIEVKAAHHGIDWHMQEVIIVPEHALDIHDISSWASR